MDKFLGYLRYAALAAGIGFAAFAVLLLAFAGIGVGIDLPNVAVSILAVFAVSVGCFLSGFFCARLIGHSGLFAGLAAGGLFAIVLLIIGMIIGKPFEGTAFTSYIAGITSGGIGGIVGVINAAKPTLHKHKK
jgi:putative membrane protein, TIGR04086 family/integral membrane protein, TIGR04097 family